MNEDSHREQPGSALASAPRWAHGLLQPMSIAAYVTWVALAIRPLLSLSRQVEPLADTQWLGLGALFGFLFLFLTAAALEQRDCRNRPFVHLLVLLQGLCAVAAARWVSQGSMPVLLIMVAAQLAAMVPIRLAVLELLAFNAALVAFSIHSPLNATVFTDLLAIAGFQAFAMLTALYARSANQAREELAAVNAHLLATRELLEATTRSHERLKISRELHDVAGHKLTALRLNLQRATRDTALAERDDLRVVAQLADELLSDIRAVVSELRRHDGVDLASALNALTRCVQVPRVHLSIDPQARIDDVATAEALLRCAQEGLTNAIRHSQAADVWLTLARHDGKVELEIRDNGRGAAELLLGNGLTGMRERVQGLGGRLRIERASGGGLALHAELPQGA
jgi:signal transduction histidine kinase